MSSEHGDHQTMLQDGQVKSGHDHPTGSSIMLPTPPQSLRSDYQQTVKESPSPDSQHEYQQTVKESPSPDLQPSSDQLPPRPFRRPSPVYGFSGLESDENREEYRKGGFHPVALFSTIGDSDRYRILHKLGYGGFSTVWLARDSIRNGYVAIKILKARVSHEPEGGELKHLQILQAAKPDHPGRERIAMPLDHFHIEGPNGSHLCLIYPVFGPRANDLRIIENFSAQSKRKMARQAAEGLAYLHANGIGHGDLKPSNILLQIANIDSWTEDELFERLGRPETEPLLLWSREPPGPSAPSHMVQPVSMAVLDRCYLTDEVKIIDFGESFDLRAPPQKLGTPAHYCSPELLLDEGAGAASDVWALACTIYEIQTGPELFEPGYDADDAITQFVLLLGKMPEPWWSGWENRKWLFDDDGDLKDPQSARVSTFPAILSDVHQMADPTPEATVTLSEEEMEACTDLLKKMLKYRPEERISAAEALAHRWFSQFPK